MDLTGRDAMLAVAGMAAIGGLAIAVGWLVVPLGAQAPVAQGPAFEVASVKPNKIGDNRVMLGMQPGGRFTATNVSARMLLTNAYRLQPFQVIGGPSWMTSDRFDISAKAEGDPSPEQIQLMMRALLADRFGLVVHNETRDLPLYALVLARPDGKTGPKLRPAATDCAAMMARGRGAAPLPPPPAPGAPMTCGMRMGGGILTAGGMPISQLASTLAQFVGRTVQDKTGLAGEFDFELSWTPEQLPQRAPGTPVDQPLRVNGADIDPNGPSVFTALQEQLGLKLDAQRGQVDVLVIDKIEQPTPD